VHIGSSTASATELTAGYLTGTRIVASFVVISGPMSKLTIGSTTNPASGSTTGPTIAIGTDSTIGSDYWPAQRLV